VHPAFAPHPTYTGAPAFAPPFHAAMMGHHHPHHEHGFCHSCCHPRSHCQCHRRECRKESKELLVNSTAAASSTDTGAAADTGTLNLLRSRAISLSSNFSSVGTIDRKDAATGMAFIGGGCCVHLSVEYIANNPANPSAVEVIVQDSENTFLAWAKLEPAATPYRIHEGIITTKPGAKLLAVAVNATVRVRWCEIFSC
jgi:hypothetical protein